MESRKVNAKPFTTYDNTVRYRSDGHGIKRVKASQSGGLTQESLLTVSLPSAFPCDAVYVSYN